MLAFEVIFERLLLAFLLSLLYGLERQVRKKPVGFGTFIFVAVGSCTLAMVAMSFGGALSPLPLLSGIITGIGFLGAGSMIRHQDKIFGATTAASIWAVAAASISIGVGMISLGILFYLLIFSIIFMDYIFEKIGFGHYNTDVIITVENPEIMRMIWPMLPKGSKLSHFSIDHKNNEHKYYFLLGSSRKKLLRILETIRKADGVKGIYFE